MDRNSVLDHFSERRKIGQSETFEVARCSLCGTEYVLAVEVTETSFLNLRAVVRDVAQVLSEN